MTDKITVINNAEIIIIIIDFFEIIFLISLVLSKNLVVLNKFTIRKSIKNYMNHQNYIKMKFFELYFKTTRNNIIFD